jgi:RHS repeat-associated protein
MPLTNDYLGSPRITTDANGAVISRRDFMPFGEEIQRASYGSDSVRQKFTGYERDTETGLDFAQARMYGSKLGRFTTTDKIFMTLQKPSDPQQWNLYTYTRNSPFKFVDPTGNLLRATGSEVWRYLRDLESIIGVNLSTDDDGIVQINSPIPNNLSATAQALIDIIQNPFCLVEVEATRDRDDVLIGGFLGSGKQVIDYGDIDLVTGGQGFSRRSIIAHETIEALSGLLNGVAEGEKLNVRDHNAGIDAENEIRNQENLSPRLKGKEGEPDGSRYIDPKSGKLMETRRIRFGDYEQVITIERIVEQGELGIPKIKGGKIVKSEVIFTGKPKP